MPFQRRHCQELVDARSPGLTLVDCRDRREDRTGYFEQQSVCSYFHGWHLIMVN